MTRRYREYRKGAYSTLYATDISYLTKPADLVPSSSSRIIIGCHGANGTGYMYGQIPAEAHVAALVNAGYSVLGIDHAKVNSWGDPDAMRAVDDAYTYVQGLGYTNAKIGFMGWSMGGQTALNWAKRNPTKVSCGWLWNPVTDLRFFRDASGAYTLPYSNSTGAVQGGKTTEINATFAPTSAAVGAYTIPAVGGSGITMTITTNTGKSFADGNNSGTVGLPQATINSRAFTYTSKTDSTLVGCLATTGTTIAVTNGMAITASYAAQSNGYRVRDEPAAWSGLGVKFKICQASDDTVVAPAMNTDATVGFVALVNHADVTLRSPNPTGDHINSIANVPTSEVVSFYQANL